MRTHARRRVVLADRRIATVRVVSKIKTVSRKRGIRSQSPINYTVTLLIRTTRYMIYCIWRPSRTTTHRRESVTMNNCIIRDDHSGHTNAQPARIPAAFTGIRRSSSRGFRHFSLLLSPHRKSLFMFWCTYYTIVWVGRAAVYRYNIILFYNRFGNNMTQRPTRHTRTTPCRRVNAVGKSKRGDGIRK